MTLGDIGESKYRNDQSIRKILPTLFYCCRGAPRLPLRESAARAGRGMVLELTGRAWWSEAPAPRITGLGAYRLEGVAELVGAARDATPVAWARWGSASESWKLLGSTLPLSRWQDRAASGRVGEPPWLSDPPVSQPPTKVMRGGGAPKHIRPSCQTTRTLITRLEAPTPVMGGGSSPRQVNLCQDVWTGYC